VFLRNCSVSHSPVNSLQPEPCHSDDQIPRTSSGHSTQMSPKDHTDRHWTTDTQIQRHWDRQTDRQTDRQRDNQQTIKLSSKLSFGAHYNIT